MQVTERDRLLLAFAAEHRFVAAAQLAALLDCTPAAADARVRALAAGGYMRRERLLAGRPAFDRITRAGLRAIASDLPPPRRPDLSLHRHDLALGWLMVAARRGRLGPLRAVVSERRMRCDDGRAEPGAAGGPHRHGTRLGGVGRGGRDRLHHPDMVVVTAGGHRVAFELELTAKPPARRERILEAYAADPRVDRVVYLVEQPSVGRAVARSAARVGVAGLVRIHKVDLIGTPPGPGAGRVRQRRHRRTRSRPAAEAGR